ncbi:MAG: nicotinate (nicotinamide) nucleotide adenylyltransferase [Candidatus Cryptobacteroides sp.]
MNVAVFPGSFNPLHIGHKAVMETLVGESGFDKVYLIVSPKNPLKDGISPDSASDRFEAALRAVEANGMTDVLVDDIELSMPSPQYTIATLDALREREPQNTFTLVVGSDQLSDIRRWKDYRRILKEFGLAVYPREGFDTAAVRAALLEEDPGYKIKLIDAPQVNISSTLIREGLAAGKDMSRWMM